MSLRYQLSIRENIREMTIEIILEGGEVIEKWRVIQEIEDLISHIGREEREDIKIIIDMKEMNKR